PCWSVRAPQLRHLPTRRSSELDLHLHRAEQVPDHEAQVEIEEGRQQRGRVPGLPEGTIHPRTLRGRGPPLPGTTTPARAAGKGRDRKSTRLDSSHERTSYAGFC